MNWETMTPEQRDALVAEKMGYQTAIMPLGGGVMWNDSSLIEPIPRYSTSIDAAWLVVEQLHRIELEYDAFYPDVESHTCKAIYERSDGMALQAWAHMMPEAICKVALKAKGVDLTS